MHVKRRRVLSAQKKAVVPFCAGETKTSSCVFGMQTKVKKKSCSQERKTERGGFDLDRPQKENIDLSPRLDVGGAQATCRLWKQSGPFGGRRGGRPVEGWREEWVECRW